MNVLLIAIDTLRADHLGCYGHDRNTSPHLDELASRGVVLRPAYLAPYPHPPRLHDPSSPARTPFSHQVVTQGGKVDLAGDVHLLPEMLRGAGYFTAAADNMGRWFPRGLRPLRGLQLDARYQRRLEQGGRGQRHRVARARRGATTRTSPGSASSTTGTRIPRTSRPRPSAACSTPAMRRTPRAPPPGR